MTVKISYELTGLGWCWCTVSAGSVSCSIRGSYISNILFDFYSAVINLLKGSESERFSFLEEPGENVWKLSKTSSEKISITITMFRSMPYRRKPEDVGGVIFDETVHLTDFALAFNEAMDELLSIWCLVGYKKKWCRHYFPLGKYEELRELIKFLPYKTYEATNIQD